MATSIDELINWYEKHKPEAGRRIEVAMRPNKMCKELGIGQEPYLDEKGIRRYRYAREVLYRGRTLVATK